MENKDELMPIEQIRERAETFRENKSNSVFDKMNTEIDNQYELNKKELATNEEFVGLTKQVVERTVKAKLAEDMLEILTQEHKNELATYYLKVQKEELHYRKKKEKKIIRQQIKAEISTKHLKALRERYQYMYKEDEPFIPNKFYNRQRELANWWNGISDNTKKLVKASLKFAFWGLVVAGFIFFGVKIVNWIITNADKLSTLNVT